MKVLHDAVRTIKDARRPYVILNLVYYGLVVCGKAYAAFDRPLQEYLMESVGGALTEGPLAAVAEAYGAQQAVQAIGLTLGINLAVGSFLSITLPSLVIPFSGLLVAGVRAVAWPEGRSAHLHSGGPGTAGRGGVRGVVRSGGGTGASVRAPAQTAIPCRAHRGKASGPALRLASSFCVICTDAGTSSSP